MAPPPLPPKVYRRPSHKQVILRALTVRNPTEFISRHYPHIPRIEIKKWVTRQISDIKRYEARRKANSAKAAKSARLDSALKKMHVTNAANELMDLSGKHSKRKTAKRLWKVTWKQNPLSKN